MHSSAISLMYRMEDKKAAKDTAPSKTACDNYLVNLVDSPGHIDFSSDVSTATRLCDGAIIVIDVLEGLCTQTHAVLYKALKERMRPCLVLNKIDRLAVELQLSPIEAFYHLQRVLENVNALASSLLRSELIRIQEQDDTITSLSIEEEEKLTCAWNFAPEQGNVIFAAALDSWGFGTGRFATIWAQRLGVNRSVLLKYFFDNYAINTSTKKLFRCDPDNNGEIPMFVSLILQPIWDLYHACILRQDTVEAEKMAKEVIGLEMMPREINSKDPRGTLQAIMRRWLPLPEALLRMVVRCVPSPGTAQKERMDTLFQRQRVLNKLQPVSSNNIVSQRVSKIKRDVETCSTSPEADVIVYIAKMSEVRVAELSPRDVHMLSEDLSVQEREDTPNGLGEVTFMALARVYSGVLRRESRIFVLTHRHDPLSSSDEGDTDGTPPTGMSTAIEVPPGSFGLYFCLGPSVCPMEEAPAGNIVGIVGLQKLLLKTGTLSSTWACEPMTSITFQSKPLVRVAVEPKSHRDLPRLESGLQRLYMYDPVVEIGVDDTGQHTMTCLGELHLEQCLKALRERFAGCEVNVSAPLVPFRETVVSGSVQARAVLPPPWKDTSGLDTAFGGRVRMVSASQTVSVTLRCCALPFDTTAVLEESVQGALVLLSSFVSQALSPAAVPESVQGLWRRVISSLETAVADGESDPAWTLTSGEQEEKIESSELFSRILAFGPKGCGCNVLIFAKDVKADIWQHLVPSDKQAQGDRDDEEKQGKLLHSIQRGQSVCRSEQLSVSFDEVWSRLQSSVLAGFQTTAAAGPLMLEQMHGVCFVIESVAVTAAVVGIALDEVEVSVNGNGSFSSGMAVSGQLLSEMRDAFRLSFLSRPMRVVEPVFACDLQCDQSQLGSLYAVLNKRRGEVIKEDIIEGTSLFLLSATLPVSESFGFAQELLKKTSGAGTAPQLMFSHWTIHQDDPFWKPTTAEEREDHGDQVVEPNQARLFIDSVRRRKGLPIEEKVVVFAEKQRNLTKMK
eukprot:CAMPEP_0182435606 /NCGR_PEP_ID=MMETSP1167-20130531/76741_1 /TAXON_ID=2988 /ORGANISM="Mallomonas Sp, Strain CCMP3275" /LENGTH=1013 /DNA_ID=CAMNT_0024626845 /DNA_START=248 /DNA_END=3289 /DNA_ORIENTATION=+